jgi:hypothetical protein
LTARAASTYSKEEADFDSAIQRFESSHTRKSGPTAVSAERPAFLGIAAAEQPLSIERLLSEGWEIAGYASG